MHIELIDLLRCPRDHEETWLVAALTAVQDRFVIKAKLGCPVCGSTYSVSRGIVDLRGESGDPAPQSGEAGPEMAVRTAALLNLTRPGSLVLLEGTYAAAAQEVSDLTHCTIIALNPSSHVADSETVATVLCDARIPFASAAVSGIACDSPELIADTPRVLRTGGRLLLPVSAALPPGMVEIARDDQNIVGEAVGEVVQLRR